MRTHPQTDCPIRTCTVSALGDAAVTADVEMSEATLQMFPADTWVTVAPLSGLPSDEVLVVEVTGERGSEPLAVIVTASLAWFISQPMLLAVHHNIGRLLANSVDMSQAALAADGQGLADSDPADSGEGSIGEAA